MSPSFDQLKSGRPGAHPLERIAARQGTSVASPHPRAELTAGETSSPVNDQAIRRVLETAGVEFIDANGGARGASARRPPKVS